MTNLEILSAQIARARFHFSQKTNLDYLNSARDLIDASAHCGGSLTLNENQTRSLAIFLESESALREVRALTDHKTPSQSTPNNIIRFSQN